jgi:transcription initiation factor IIF auxiliary subunit
MGWGEFDISIKIYFVEEYEKPIEVFHPLKVYKKKAAKKN